MQQEYSLSDLKGIFPNMNFSFINNTPIIPQLLHILNGRIVGGIIRDSLLGFSTNDLDIATPYLPEEALLVLTKAGFHPVSTGIEYGTISLFFKNMKVEITSLRKDVQTFGRRAKVEFGGTWQEDSIRRDFTFNGLFLSLSNSNNITIYDYHQGIEDLKNGVVKFIGNYENRIQEDYLRILRFIRFFIRYSKNLDYLTYIHNNMTNLLTLISQMNLLSMERVLMEIQSILIAENWKLGIEMMNTLGISQMFFKEILYVPSFSLPISIDYKKETIRFIYVFSLIDKKLINQLPINKENRTLLLLYQHFSNDPSLHNILYIWTKAKTLKVVNFIITLWQYVNLTNIYNVNITDEEFEQIKQQTPLLHTTGIERGIEEKNIKLAFIKNKICK